MANLNLYVSAGVGWDNAGHGALGRIFTQTLTQATPTPTPTADPSPTPTPMAGWVSSSYTYDEDHLHAVSSVSHEATQTTFTYNGNLLCLYVSGVIG